MTPADIATSKLILDHIKEVRIALANPLLTEAQRKNLTDTLAELHLSLEAILLS
jgi:hypothetical protein